MILKQQFKKIIKNLSLKLTYEEFKINWLLFVCIKEDGIIIKRKYFLWFLFMKAGILCII